MAGLYVSSVAGHLVTRFGTTQRLGGVPSPGLLIGAERDRTDPTKVTWDESKIVHIPEPEASTYVREYQRAIRYGELRRRTEVEYLAQTAAAEAAKD
jgi:hypothetical protein